MLDRQISPRAGVAVLVLSLLGLAGLVALLLGGEAGSPVPPAPPVAPVGTVPDGERAMFLGDAACAACHPAIFHTYRHSRHAATLHRLLPGQLPAHFPDHAHFTDPSTGLQYAFVRRGDRYLFEVRGPGGTEAEPAEFAFGSGKTGITLVSRVQDGALREFRMSYFPARRRWEVTPGQKGMPADPLGRLHDPAAAQRCFTCHSTRVLASQVAPEPRFMGVGCETCHGPGRPHLDALARGDPHPHIDNPGRWDGARVIALCARCHRGQQDLDPLDPLALAQTQRFQPLGLAKSACFRHSAGRLSCVTCHDAHENARLDPAHYEAVCLSCHGNKAGDQAFARSDPSDQSEASEPLDARTPERPNARICPVNPRSGCVTCHMPQREVVRGITMADHWIRVFRSSSAQEPQP